jgi:hypothetical protein
MSYAQGGIIQANDYNNLAWGGNTTGVYNSTITNTAQVMGVGFGFRGYGQPVTPINTVAVNGTVTGTQWAGLIYLVNRGLGHQSGAGAQLGSGGNLATTAGSTIVAYANVATAVGTINTNANLYTAQGSTTTGSVFNQSITGGNNTFEVIFNRVLTWSSADAARYFFNCGGQVNWVITGATNNNGSLRSADVVTQWATYQASGSIRGVSSVARTGTGGTVNTASTTLGYWQSTTAMQTLSQITSTNYRYEYNSDYTNVRVKTSGVSGSNGDKGAVMTIGFGTYKFSTYAGLNDDVNVTVSHRIDVVAPSTTYLQVSWGLPTIT